MEKLKLDNKIFIISQIKQICKTDNKDYIEFLEDIYLILTSEKEENRIYNILVKSIVDKLKNYSFYEAEEELFHIVSFELNNIYTEDVISNANENDLIEINNFLNENYFEIFKNYYSKKGIISDEDYDECVLSVFNNYDLDEYIADILVGKYIEDNIIDKKF